MKIIAFVLTFLINAAIGAAAFVALIMVLNGFQERDAVWGIYLYVGLALAACLILSMIAALIGGRPFMREMKQPLPMIAFVAALSFIGGIVDFVLVFVGMIAAEIARNLR